MMGALLQGIIVAGVLQHQATYRHDLAPHTRPAHTELSVGEPGLAHPCVKGASPDGGQVPPTAAVLPPVAK